MLADDFPDAADEPNNDRNRQRRGRSGVPRSRPNGHELRLAGTPPSQDPVEPKDAADAFLARLERVDAGTLDISQLLDDLQPEALPDHQSKQASASSLQDAASVASARSASPAAPAKPLPNAAAGNATRSTKQEPAPTPALEIKAHETARLSLGEDVSASQQVNGRRFAALGVGALLIVGIAFVGLRRTSAPATAPAPSTAPANAATPASPAAAPAVVDVETQVRQFADAAQQHLTAGERSAAIDAVAQGLALRSADTSLRALSTRLAANAREAYATARREARRINATGTPRYVEAERLVRDLSRRRGVPPLDAARTYESAIAAMNASADEARVVAEAKAAASAAVAAAVATAPAATAPSATAPAVPAPTPTTPRVAESNPAVAQVAPPAASTPPPVAAAPVASRVEAPPHCLHQSQHRRRLVTRTSPRRRLHPRRHPTTDQQRGNRRQSKRSTASDEQSIRGVLQAYADAYSRLDAGAVQRVYPSTDVAGLQRSFARDAVAARADCECADSVNDTATVNLVWQTVGSNSVRVAPIAAPRKPP
ncbi:MAG: hypothetical protein U0Q11_25095 [Vicinamibacterales bacterium]